MAEIVGERRTGRLGETRLSQLGAMPWTALLLALTIAVAGLGRTAVTDVTLRTDLAAGPHPFFIAAHALELYLVVPIAALAGCALLTAPGLLAALAFAERREDFGGWLLKGFAIGLVLVTTYAACVQALLGGAVLEGAGFFWSLAALDAAALALVWRRDARGAVHWAMFAGRGADVAVMVLVPLGVLLLLSPKFYWEDFNGDGAHALQAARLIIYHVAPIWPAGAGPVSSYPSIGSVIPSLPISWLVRLYGDNEFAVRLSLLWGLPFAAGALLALIRHERTAEPHWAPLGVGLVLLCYCFCLAFNASYDPYFADIALPLAREPLILVTFLGFIVFYLRFEPVWIFAFALLSYMTAPGAPVLLGAWLAAAWLALSPRPWLSSVYSALAVVLAIVLCIAATALLKAAGLGEPSSEFDSAGILTRLRYITLDDWQRWLFWILPAGIVPVAALPFWPWQDRVARAFTLMSVFYFLFFYVQAYRILPHHFTPIMLTPLIVFWRLRPVREHPAAAVATTALGALAAAVLSAPPLWRPHLEASRLGETIRIENPRHTAIDPQEIGAAQALLSKAFPVYREEDAAAHHHLGSALQWYYYALRPKPAGAQTTYVIRPDTVAGPAPGIPIERENGWTMYALDLGRYRADRDQAGIARTISPRYYVPRNSIAGAGDAHDYRHVWSRHTIAAWVKRKTGL